MSHPSFENFNAFLEFCILAFEFVDEIPEIIVTCSEVYGIVAIIDFLLAGYQPPSGGGRVIEHKKTARSQTEA